MNDHLPVRPEWTCSQGCSVWPCEPAKASLIDEFIGARPSLGVYLAACWMTAVLDMPGASVDGLYARMLAWARERSPASR